LRDLHVIVYAAEDCRLDEESPATVDGYAIPAGDQLGTLFFPGFDVSQNGLHLLLADNRTHSGFGIKRIAGLQPLRPRDQLFHKLILNFALYEQSRAGVANLALAIENAVNRALLQAICLANGITELLTTYLSTNRSLRVSSRTTAMRYKRTDKSIPRIAKELGVDRVLEGAVAHSGKRVRITARLVDPSTDHNEWVGCYEAEIQDLLEVQDQVAWAVTRDTAAHLTPTVKEQTMVDRPVAVESGAAYLQGRVQLAEGIG